MILSNLRAHPTFLTILLVLCCFFAHAAIASQAQLPASLYNVLQGTASDLLSVSSELKDTDLPAALSIIELLKFKALHQETSVTPEQINNFELLIKNRLANSAVVSFSKTETCRSKVNTHEIKISGQKITVPEYYVADIGLIITDVIPAGEAGTVFPDIQINFLSQSPITEYRLNIDGNTVPNSKISVFVDDNGQGLIFRPDLNADSILSIGTHTAEITIKNKFGESTTRKWSFTVGLCDVPTTPLPVDVEIIGEVELASDKLFPSQKLTGSLRAIICQDKSGKRYTEYSLKTSSGQIIRSRNLALLVRKASAGRTSSDELSILPLTGYAFIGNAINFSYSWSGSGQIINASWKITSGGVSTTETSIKIAGKTTAICTLTIEETKPDGNGNQVTYQYEQSNGKDIHVIEIFSRIQSDRQLLISNNATASFNLQGYVSCSLQNDLKEGAVYNYDNFLTPGILKVNQLRWKLHAEDGSPLIANPVATQTQLLFNKNGFAEVIFDAKLVWQQAGENYESDFKPDTSALYAFYPVQGSAKFSKYPQGQITVGRRQIELQSFAFDIKNQKRIINSPNDLNLAQPVLICSSSLWPASSPLNITRAAPVLYTNKTGLGITQVNPFLFQTPMVISDDSIPVNLGGIFYKDDYDQSPSRPLISGLPTIPVYEVNDLANLLLSPSDSVTIYEGSETSFNASLEPVAGYGTGSLSESDKTLDMLSGYKVSSVNYIHWLEIPVGEEDDWKSKASKTTDFSHIFDPFIGPGSYTMNCGFAIDLRESDTGDEVPAYLESLVPVDVLPGLRIFSPINDLAYPLHANLKVKTSFDKDNDTWKKIKWRLNGKEFKPGVGEAPFFIDLNRTGKWSLQAELTVKDPQTGEDIPLKDRIDFVVNPIEISLTPTRKVLDFSTHKSQELSLNITLNGKKVEKPGKPIEWSDDGLKAIVDPIEWFSAHKPNGCATANHDEDSLTASVGFADAGAATLLATVTVRLTDGEDYFRRRHKGFEDEFEEPIFTFPAVRTDLWAIQQEWVSFSGIFPNRAIMGTQRFFHLENGTVKINSKSYTWLTEGIFDETCEIAPALLGAASLKANRITVDWFAPENQTSSDFSFKPQFLLEKKTEITLKSSIDFGSGNNLKPEEKKYEVSVSPLSDVIDSIVKTVPISLTINQPSVVGLFFGPKGGALTTQDKLLVWGDEYQIKLGNVTWLVGSGGLPGVVISPTEANFAFVREHPGEYMVYARPDFEVKEVVEDVGPTRIQLEAQSSKVHVSASVVSWFLDPERMDHLDMLYYLRPDGSPNPVWYYTNKHRIWWNVGVKVSIPFVVGCDSYVHLIPEFTEANRPDITRLNYQWLTTDNLPIGNEGIVDCAEGADVPTPEKIGKYHLRLEAEGCDEIVIHTEVYVVQQITAHTYKENFFIDCVRNSVTALSGFDKNTDGKTLIDKFYYWWWNSYNQENGNLLEYGVQAWSVKDVILRKGGMCGGLGNYFYKSLKCHGFAGLNRIGFDLLTKNYPVPDSDDKSWDPVTTEYWGAVIYTDPGLNQETMPDNKFTRWPSEISTGTYHLSYANRYTGADKIPPVDIQKVVIDRQLNVEVNTTDRFYMFFAPNDGHALVFYTDSSTQTWLYDPSFGSGKYGAIKVDFPDLGKDTIIKRLGIATNTGIWSYLAKSIGYLRGFTYFKDHNIYKGISVFDIPFNSVNYLKVRFRKYVDYTFSYWGD